MSKKKEKKDANIWINICEFLERIVMVVSYLFYAIEASVVSIAMVAIEISEKNLYGRVVEENEYVNVIKNSNINMVKAMLFFCAIVLILEVLKYVVKCLNKKYLYLGMIAIEAILAVVIFATNNLNVMDLVIIIGLLIRSIMDYVSYKIKEVGMNKLYAGICILVFCILCISLVSIVYSATTLIG